MDWLRQKRFVIALICGCFFVALAVWLSSGTMAPYAATLEKPHLDKPCNYLINSDHSHFVATFRMLDGGPREQWGFSIYLRRILFPILAYPLMKAWGFMVGGFVTSLIIQLAAFVGFALYVRKRIGHVAAITSIALLATYPGIYYWAGLPYCHVMIVPASLVAMILLSEIERYPTLLRVALLSLLLGMLFLAYDLLPLLAPPAIAILLFRKRFIATIVAAVMLILPTLVDNKILSWKYDIPFQNKNTQTYFDVLNAYVQPKNYGQWGTLLSRAPGDFARNYFFSNFYFLPALFIVLIVINLFARRLRLRSSERWLLATVFALFAFINLAPPTPGWQFRGSGLARIYQPVFIALLFFTIRMMQDAWTDVRLRRVMIGLIAATVALNAAVVLGPALRIRLADRIYLAFYRHAQTEALATNLDTFGRRPLGFCDTSFTQENPLSRTELRAKRVQRIKRLKKRPPTPAATVPSTGAAASMPARGG